MAIGPVCSVFSYMLDSVLMCFIAFDLDTVKLLISIFVCLHIELDAMNIFFFS